MDSATSLHRMSKNELAPDEKDTIKKPKEPTVITNASRKVGPTEATVNVAREMGSPRQTYNRRRRTREGSGSSCVQTPLLLGWCEGRSDVLKWYRLLSVVETFSETHGGEVSGHHVTRG